MKDTAAGSTNLDGLRNKGKVKPSRIERLDSEKIRNNKAFGEPEKQSAPAKLERACDKPMKAMTCPQCGALIRKISLKEKFAECEYCDARILLEENRDKIVEIPDKTGTPDIPPPTPWKQYRENHRQDEYRAAGYKPLTYPKAPEAKPTVLSSIVVFAFIFIIAAGGFMMLAAVMFSTPELKTPSKTPEKSSFKPAASPSVANYPPPTPEQSITYQVNVKWNGANDMEHFENPELRNEDLPTLDEKELKKTVFKNREARVRVTIGTDGEVAIAEGISGHPVLLKAAVAAAQKSLFSPRAKPTSRILTYHFRLVTE